MKAPFNSDICQRIEKSLPLEWLETNGIGGYGSSSVAGANTRKYHGLFVASLPDLANKFVLLSKMDASMMVDGEEVECSTNHYPGAFHPKGYEMLHQFVSDPVPCWSYRVGNRFLESSLCLVKDENLLLLKYRCPSESEGFLFRLKPFLAYRVNHELTKCNDAINGKLTIGDNSFSVSPYEGMPSLHFSSSSHLEVLPMGTWFKNFEYYRERERGFSYHEDLYCPAVLELDLKPGDECVIAVSLGEEEHDGDGKWTRELEFRQRRSALAKKRWPNESLSILDVGGEQFLTRNSRSELSITAGYPWFVEWGRDTMIALPGLTITRSQPELGLEILKSYAKHEKNGLIPNYLAIGDGEHAYNSIDASLWFFWSIGELMKVPGYKSKVKTELLSTMENIIRAYLEDRVPQAELREDGLIHAGNLGTQLTWMDANAYGRPVTPRHGCPVEINALFMHAIHLYKSCAPLSSIAGLEPLEKRLRKAFVEHFWLETGYLADVVRNDGVDDAVRPNQIFAVSLESCPLSLVQKRKVVEKVRQDLLTPYGLRTLSDSHHEFKPRYEGTGDERDNAYHQGTVWPWLLGHFIEASLSTAQVPKQEAKRLKQELQPLLNEELWGYGLGSVAEVYDATAPHRAAGTIAQAWSVSELLRGCALIEKVLG
jgi:predicted glycogen debranching enzyme